MEQQLWSRINEVVLAALERPAGERPTFVEAACGSDRRLRREVESLLGPGTDTLRRLERPIFQWFGSSARHRPEPRRIGPYLVQRELGRGGMAVVYLARRADGADRREVALKLLKPGMDSSAIVRRFQNEGQILAGLNHPNIAQLYGGGRTDASRPYLVMERVEGEPVDRYCDRRRMPIRQRLILFRQICHAVQFAHQNLVVHLDLKPSNVLVTADGVPKLLDFGIAKLIHPEYFTSITLTATGLRPMTPEYASPEQVSGLAITIASDVYSLGVLLYELLSGHRPYHFERRDEAELRRAICEIEPERPSSAVLRTRTLHRSDGTTVELTPERVSQTREGEPRRLHRRLRGDLDNIATRALHKDPRRRYPSVSRLADDVTRHLEGHPIAARRPTLAYRAAKLLQRRRKEAVAAALAVVLLAAVIVDRELQQRRTARERDKAEQVRDFLVELFEASDPNRNPEGAAAMREILDRGTAKIDRLGDQPEIQAALMNTLGRVYRNLGYYATADPLLEEALELRRRLHGTYHPEIAESLSELATLHWARGDYPAAETLLRDALAMRRQLLRGDHPEIAASLNDLAVLLRDQGKYDAAEPLYRQALGMYHGVFGDSHPEVATALSNLAALRYSQGDYAGAEPLFREALAMRRATLGDEHPDVASSLNNLASLLHARGNHEAAEPLYRQALEMRRRLFGPQHPEVAASLNNLASLLHARGEFRRAEPLYRQALEMSRQLLGDEHPDVALALNNLATVLLELRDLEAAEPFYRQALALFRQLLGEEHPFVAGLIQNLAVLHFIKGDLAAAEKLYRESLERRLAVVGDQHPDVAEARSGLARVLLATGKGREAETLARRAVATLQQQLPPGHWRTAYAQSVLGGCLSELRRHREAEPLLTAGYAALRAAKGPRSWRTLDALGLLIAHYEGRGMPDEAAPYRARLVAAQASF